MLHAWAERAETIIAQWDEISMAKRNEVALDLIRSNLHLTIEQNTNSASNRA